MVKVIGPCFSLEAHGKLDECLIYQDINGEPVVKAVNFPTYRRTVDQGIIRDTFYWASRKWLALCDAKQQGPKNTMTVLHIF